MSTAVLQAAKVVPLTVLKRFRAVICEDSSKIPLPNELTGLRLQSGAYDRGGQSAYAMGPDAGSLIRAQTERGAYR